MKNKLKNFILDTVFPKFCLGCNIEGEWLCSACKNKIVKVKTQVCPHCGRISQFGRFCSKGRKSYDLSGIIVACYYDEGPIKEIIHNFKYNNILELKNILGGLLIDSLEENIEIGKDPLITAVPLHFLRKAQRGFNQSEVLAEVVAENINLQKNFKIIQKKRKTTPQVLTDGKKRKNNLKNSFKINKNIDISKRTIILVDDVITTGTTLSECARLLRKAGAKKVWGLVISKG